MNNRALLYIKMFIELTKLSLHIVLLSVTNIEICFHIIKRQGNNLTFGQFLPVIPIMPNQCCIHG